MSYSLKTSIKNIFCLLVKALNGRRQRKNALLIVQLAGIGDLVIGNSILPYIRRTYPTHHITYLVRESHTALIEACPYIDDILKYPEKTINKSIKVRWNFFSTIVNSCFDIVIYPYRSRTSSVEEMVFLTGAREVISYEQDLKDHNAHPHVKTDQKYTKLFPHAQQAVSEIETHRLFLEWLGCSEVKSLEPAAWTADNDAEISGKFKDIYDFDFFKQPYMVFFPGALSPIRFWQISKYVEIAQKVLQKYPGIAIVICGGTGDVALGKGISGQLSGDVLDLCGKTDLRELAFILKNSALYLGSETGAYHLSVSSGIPNICILGGGVFRRFAPYNFGLDRNISVHQQTDCFGCNWSCRFDTVRCMESVTAEMVWNKANQILEKAFDHSSKKALNK